MTIKEGRLKERVSKSSWLHTGIENNHTIVVDKQMEKN